MLKNKKLLNKKKTRTTNVVTLTPSEATRGQRNAHYAYAVLAACEKYLSKSSRNKKKTKTVKVKVETEKKKHVKPKPGDC